jgi:hypothetical protein
MGASVQPRIAFLVDNLTSECPAELAAGVLRAARQVQARVLIVPGGAPRLVEPSGRGRLRSSSHRSS